MQIVNGKTGGNKATVVQGNKVECDHVTLHKASGENYQLHTTFIFDGVPQDRILALATETLLIRWRTAFKNADTVDEEADHQVIQVTKMLQGSKPRMSKKDKAIRTIADMSRDEKLAIIRQLALEQGIEVELPEDENE